MDQRWYGLELSTQVLLQEAERRGYKPEVIDPQDNFIRLHLPGRVEYVKQATKTSLDTYITPLIMENKEVTKLILREHGIRVPDGVSVQSPREAEQAYEKFKGQGIVVKPKSTNYGLGVSVLKEATPETYMQAVRLAFEHDNYIMIESFIPGREYRFLVIGDETVAVLHRMPANVQGDGVRTIAELVEEKNKDPRRGVGHVKPLERIMLGELEREYLRMQGLDIDSVPAEGQVVFLRENSNISTGGDSIDMTDNMPEYYKNIAVKAAQAVGARICGADIIIDDLSLQPGPERYCIIELNFNPALHIHNFPSRGQNRHVEKKVLDLLEKLAGNEPAGQIGQLRGSAADSES